MNKLKMHTPDLTKENIATLVELFPDCVTESRDEAGKLKQAIDFDQLRQLLSDHVVEGPQERYHLNWPGKREALLAANTPIAKTLRPCRDESVDFATTRNLFIEGDNLDALKLLQETYLNAVKLVYIDPPYNTGRDFIYRDRFAQSDDEYLYDSHQRDENGHTLVANPNSSGRFHSTWLSMMYSRLRLARNVLADDGAIVISIDDGEHANLKRMCDEIFGDANFIVSAVWRSRDNSSNDAQRFSNDHNHIIIYSKSPTWTPARINDDSKRSHFKNPDNDPDGPYFDGNPLNSPHYRENLVYDLESPQGNVIKPPKNGWRWSKSVLLSKIESGEIRFTPDGTAIRRRTYLKDMEGLPPSSLWTDLDVTGHNRQAKYELLKLLPEDIFDTPKPVRLLKYIIQLASVGDSDIVLDFFAGSATTADAVLQQNAEDGKRRRYIMVQLPEQCGDDTDASKAGFRTIADIAKERMRRAGAAIAEQLGLGRSGFDVGFRVLKIGSSNLKDVYYRPDEAKPELLGGHVDNIKEDRTDEDLLFQVLLDWGVDLSLPIKNEKIAGKNVLFVDQNALAACFETGIDEAFVKELAGRKPLRVVFRDTSYGGDDVKINVEQIFKQLSPGTEVKTL